MVSCDLEEVALDGVDGLGLVFDRCGFGVPGPNRDSVVQLGLTDQPGLVAMGVGSGLSVSARVVDEAGRSGPMCESATGTGSVASVGLGGPGGLRS
jgi:hypothetical protein